MALNPSNRIGQIVKVAEVRKQRLANAAATARRVAADAEAHRARAEADMRKAASSLREADDVLLHSGTSEQMLVWRTYCVNKKHESIALHGERTELCAEAKDRLAQSLVAVQRQDLRHDALATEAMAQRRRDSRIQETRTDDELQGCAKGRQF